MVLADAFASIDATVPWLGGESSLLRGTPPYWLTISGLTLLVLSSKREMQKPSNRWFPLMGPKPGFIPSFPTYRTDRK